MRNSFHGDPRLSLWSWRAPARKISHSEAKLIAPIHCENEQVSGCVEKLSGSKLGMVLHVTCTRANAINIFLVANSILVRSYLYYTSRCALDTYIRGHICTCVLAIVLSFVTHRGCLHSVLDLIHAQLEPIVKEWSTKSSNEGNKI